MRIRPRNPFTRIRCPQLSTNPLRPVCKLRRPGREPPHRRQYLVPGCRVCTCKPCVKTAISFRKGAQHLVHPRHRRLALCSGADQVGAFSFFLTAISYPAYRHQFPHGSPFLLAPIWLATLATGFKFAFCSLRLAPRDAARKRCFIRGLHGSTTSKGPNNDE